MVKAKLLNRIEAMQHFLFFNMLKTTIKTIVRLLLLCPYNQPFEQ